MSDKASSHIKPCNTKQSEAHNWRTKEYLQRIKKEDLYIRTDLSRSNDSWVAPEAHGMSLDDYHNMLTRIVKEKTGRAMQMKVRERVNKKTGKVVKVNGSSAYAEGTKEAYSTADQWQDLLNIEEMDMTPVSNVTASGSAEATGYYTTDGKQVSTLQRGINIIRYSDGTVRKVLVK